MAAASSGFTLVIPWWFFFFGPYANRNVCAENNLHVDLTWSRLNLAHRKPARLIKHRIKREPEEHERVWRLTHGGWGPLKVTVWMLRGASGNACEVGHISPPQLSQSRPLWISRTVIKVYKINQSINQSPFATPRRRTEKRAQYFSPHMLVGLPSHSQTAINQQQRAPLNIRLGL